MEIGKVGGPGFLCLGRSLRTHDRDEWLTCGAFVAAFPMSRFREWLEYYEFKKELEERLRERRSTSSEGILCLLNILQTIK